MAESNTRQENRAPVTLKIKFKSETLDQFIERYSVDISHGGIFIRTKDPLSVGTTLRFEFQLKDATPLIIGDGTVVWTREHDPKRAGISPGMGVRFDKLPPESQNILDRVLAKKNGEPEAEESTRAYDGDVDDDDDDDGGFVETPTRVAPAALVDSLMSHSSKDDYEASDPTPLPKPMPFGGDEGGFGDEAFEESTRVASLDSMLAHAESAEASRKNDEEVISSSSRPPSREMKVPAASDPFGDLSDVDEDGRAGTNVDASSDDSTDDQEEDESDRAETIAKEDNDDELAARRNDDREEDEGVTSSSTTSKAAKATVMEVPDTDEGGSSMRWIGVAMVILLIGGAGGSWLLMKGDKKTTKGDPSTEPAPVTTKPVPPVVAPVVNEDAIKDPVKDPIPPPVATTEVVITTAPAGAMVSVEGTDMSAASPATFALPEGESFKVTVTHPGFVAQTLDVVADGSPVALATLVAMPKQFHFTSEPSGAVVTVNGRRLAAKTPTDMPLVGTLANAPSVRVRMTLPGHRPLVANVNTSDEFVVGEEKQTKTFAGSMVALPVRKPRIIKKPPPPKDDGPTPTTDPPKDDPPKDDPPKDDPPKDDPPKDDPPKDPVTPDPFKPDPGEPIPDWMK